MVKDLSFPFRPVIDLDKGGGKIYQKGNRAERGGQPGVDIFRKKLMGGTFLEKKSTGRELMIFDQSIVIYAQKLTRVLEHF